MTPTPDPKKWLELLAKHAADLRAAGVIRVRAGEYEADIAPDAPPAPDHVPDDVEGMYGHSDPLEDPATYPGGRVPSFRQREP